MNKKTILLIAVLLLALGMQAKSKQLTTNEELNRGVVALPNQQGQVYVSWRTLPTDRKGEAFQVFRNGELLTSKALTDGGTFFVDEHPLNGDATYEVRGGGKNGSYTLKADSPAGYIVIPLNVPEDGVTPAGEAYRYLANDASMGDVDGDGEYEIILLWNPTNAHDNSHTGYTGNVLMDCYKLSNSKSSNSKSSNSKLSNCQMLWRIDLGKNIRAGAHYSQFMVYDFDGDGRCEIICKTADGTTDGQGKVIGDGTKDWRSHLPTEGKANWDEVHRVGRILDGPEYLTVFEGLTGKALYTTDYIPGRGDVKAWGDNYGNRCDRFLAAVAYLDGKRPSAVFCRGYYTRTVLAAWDWDGKQLKQRWVFDTDQPQWADYAGQGNHNLRVADVDGDGCDEITYGSMAVDNDGRGLYNTGMGHGDAIHLVPQPDGPLLIWDCHENKKDGVDLRDAKTGKIIFQQKSPLDVGRCMAADFDPQSPGLELWSITDRKFYNTKGEVVHESIQGRWTCNFGIWWDGDLARELLDRSSVFKYIPKRNAFDRIMRFEGCEFNNGTKQNPCLQADLLGDWREEVVVRTQDNRELRIYVSPHPTPYRIDCLAKNRAYRISVATENVSYNQPPEPDIYIGPDKTDYLK